MLGIIFGVAAVIAMLSIGEGARQESLEQIEVLGVRNIIIRSMDVEADVGTESGEKKLRPIGISIKDANAIRDICDFADNIAITWESTIEARTYSGSVKGTLVGTTPDYAPMFNLRLTEGTFFVDHHMRSYANVCVIGAEVKKKLFGFQNPLNQLIKLQDQWFLVIGVIQNPEINSTSEETEQALTTTKIFVPLTTAMAKYPRQTGGSGSSFYAGRRRIRFGNNDEKYLDRSTIDQIAVQVDKNTQITEAAQVISALLEKRHNDQHDFIITIPEQLIEQSQKTQRIFNIVMGAIAGISLLVGGIGIMNIMLASVLERTREIGIRRAIGATRTTVIVQFLAEATMLSVVGGLVGIGLGFGLTKVIAIYAGWRTIISAWAVLLAFGVAVATGIGFGFYPARRAALQDIIESLRYE
jgi:putative ABC transport system permease protein